MKDIACLVDKLIGENGNWHLVGDKMTIGDFYVACFLFNSLLND